jgi:hypothetical protein
VKRLPTQELRTGRYPKVLSHNPDVLNTAAVLALPPELGQTGLTLLTPETVESLLTDRRQAELVQPFRLALLKLASQEAARLMAAGEYELALPVALDAVKQGQALFRPAPALQLFPLYLLAAQVCELLPFEQSAFVSYCCNHVCAHSSWWV